MKIETGTIKYSAPLDTAQEKPVARQAEEARQPAKPGDTAFSVQLSARLQQIAATSPDDDEIRQAKVAAIRDQLASGNYNISGKDVATKILNALKG